MGPLTPEHILAIYNAAIECDLASQQGALLAGLPPSYRSTLPDSGAPAQRLLLTLHAMNEVPALSDGTVPLLLWLRNAVTLAAARPEQGAFAAAIAALIGDTSYVHPPASVPAATPRSAKAGRHALRDLGILWVDDEPFALNNWKVLLSAMGARVFSAFTLAEGIAELQHKEGTIGLVILDIMMNIGPDAGLGREDVAMAKGGYESGLVFARYLKERHSTLPVVALSAYADEFAVRWLEQAGIPLVEKRVFKGVEDFVDAVVLTGLRSQTSAAHHL